MPTAKAPPPQSQTKQSEANKTQAVPAPQQSLNAGQPGQTPDSSSPSTVWNWQGGESLANFRRNCDILRPRARDLVRQLEACPFPTQPESPAPPESAILPANNDSNAKLLNLPRSRPQELMAAEAAAINVQKSRDGNWVLVFRGKPLYSRYKPLEECKKWIAKDLRKETNSAIFAGFGLGYQIEELLSHRSRALILVVESSYALFKAALCLRDLGHLLSNPKFFCSVGPTANLELYLHHFSERSFQFYQLQALYNCQHSFYQPLQRRILSLLSRFRINANTLNRFGPLWIKNIAMNLCELASASDAAVFYQRFEGLSFLLIAAGPSLESLLPQLPKLRQRFVLLAVDTALGLLQQQGIEPDFVISVDPQLLNARHFDFCEAPRSILVSESCIYPSIFQRRWRFRALFHSSIPLMEQFERQIGGVNNNPQFGQVKSGGSVATAAWDFARKCKASRLYVAGLDLSYPTLHSHCRGTMSQRNSLIRGNRLKPVEHQNWRVTISAGAQRVSSWQGPTLKVLSDKRMNVYRSWLEESLKKTDNWPNYVIDGSGGRAASIEGMELIQLETALREPERREEIEQRLDLILGEARQPATSRHDKLLHAIDKLLQEMGTIYRWSEELLALLSYRRRNSSQEKRLRELHSRISRSPSCHIVSFFFTDKLSQMLGRSPEQVQEEQLERDRLKIYQRFYLSVKFHLYWLHTAQCQLQAQSEAKL